MIPIAPAESTRKRSRPLRFGLGLMAMSGLIVAAPIVGPRLVAGSKWDEPDVRPIRKVDEAGHGVRSLSWSRDGKSVRYFVESYANRSREQGQLWQVERTWPEMKPVARREVLEGSNQVLWNYLADAALEGRGLGVRPEISSAGNLTLGVSSGQDARRLTPQNRSISERVGRRLRLFRAGRLLRSWPLPDGAPGSMTGHTPLLSPDGRLAMAVTRSLASIGPPRTTVEVLSAQNAFSGSYGGSYEFRAWRVSDGKLALLKRFSGQAQGRDADGGTWMQRLSYETPVLFDGRALWFALAPYHLPRGAIERFRATGAMDNPEQAARKLREQCWLSGEMVLFDALSGRSRTLSPSSPRRVHGGRDLYLDARLSWEPIALAPDRSLMAAKISGSGSMRVLEQLGWGTLFVWDFQSGRLLWQRAPAESNWITHAQFSPDKKLLAYAVARVDNVASDTSIVVAHARTGRIIGAPLLEQSPRQRFEQSRLRWQRSLQDQTRRISNALASSTPTPVRRQDDRFLNFEWSPDSRFIVSTYMGARLKIWRVPAVG